MKTSKSKRSKAPAKAGSLAKGSKGKGAELDAKSLKKVTGGHGVRPPTGSGEDKSGTF